MQKHFFSSLFRSKNGTIAPEVLDEIVHSVDNFRFFAPSPQLTMNMIARLGHLVNQEKPFLLEELGDNGDEEEILESQKNLISEQLYAYLAIKSDSPVFLDAQRLGKRISLPVTDIITIGFCKSIGLSSENEDENLLSDLINEFSLWIGEINHFPARWGEIISEEAGFLSLVPKDIQTNSIGILDKNRGRIRTFDEKAKTRTARAAR